MSAISTDTVREGPTFASTFWVQGVLLRVVIGCCLFGLTFYQPLPMALLAAVLATDLCAFIWALIKFNAVASAHLNETGRFWQVTSGFGFFFLAAIAALISWWLLFDETNPPKIKRDSTRNSLSRPEPTGERFVAEISRDRTEIILKGVFANGLVLQLEPHFNAPNKIDTMVLNSPGGNVYEARLLAEDIQRRGLATHVSNECSASCLLAFMAGESRTLGIGGQLGFHRYGIDFVQVLPHVSPLREMRVDQQYYLQRGVSLDFLDKVFDLNRDAVWYPTRRELQNAGIITQ